MGDLRDSSQRKADVLAMLEGHPHAWLATAHAGDPHVIVTATVWDGESLVIATRGPSRTARNLAANGVAQLAFGNSDDAVLIDVELVRSLPAAEAGEIGDVFEGGAGWSAADQGPEWRYFALRPVRIQAYRGYGEIEGRDVMKGGHWLA